ncbi:MAG TPA: malate dehydrogenase, partial [Legionella sp.]|nr:malate dehydrogenase [Legionella sp.]
MSTNDVNQQALDYHEFPRPGKLAVHATKPMLSQNDLSLAYTPGVGAPVLAIAEHAQDVYRYTAKGNLIAVMTNGTAILGLGNKGPLASKPVMEGKAVLFKQFADIDVFDIEMDADDPQDFIATAKRISPTFGGINLEDIKAPECFEIELALIEQLNIPVF